MRNNSTFARGFLLAAAMILAAPILISAQTPNVPPQITAAVDNSLRVALAHSTHPMAQAAFDVGRLDGGTAMERMILVLDGSPEQGYELRTLLDSQQSQGSPDYHNWLTPDQFGARFGPAQQDIQAVTSWLQSQGFTIGSVARSGRWIEFSGTSAQVEAAFQTQMHRYLVNGEAHVANATDISIPTALAPVVRGVASLHNFFKRPTHTIAGLVQRNANGTFSSIAPDYNFPGGGHNLAPADFAKMYDVPNLLLVPAPGTVWSGTGQTIAIVARTDIDPQDITDFQNDFGLPVAAPTFIHNGSDPGNLGGGEQVETTIDTSWSMAVAPGATIDVVISGSTLISDGVDLSDAFIVDSNLGQIVSASFGSCEAGGGNGFANAIWQQAAAQGISVFVSTGDTGAAGCDPDAKLAPGATGGVGINGLASSWYDTAVGGLEFSEGAGTYWSASNGTNHESALGYIPEWIWNHSCSTGCEDPDDSLEAGGGGVSTIYATPPYQTLSVAGLQTTLNAFTLPPPNQTMHPRGIPDISLTASANHDGYLLCLASFGTSCESGSPVFLQVGGTSVASPAFAGGMALVDQAVAKPQGLANYVLYPLAAASANYNSGSCNSSSRTNPATPTTCVFNDVTFGTNGVPGNDITNDPVANALGYPSGTGYDLASGLGSVDFKNLINAWSTAAAAFHGSVTTITSPASITITHGQSVALTGTVANSAGATTAPAPTGVVTLIPTGAGAPSQFSVGAGPLQPGVGGAGTSTVSGNFTGFPGGSYHVIATYPGDGTFAGSTSISIGVTVTKEPSEIILVPYTTATGDPPYTVPYGTPFIFEAQITGQSGVGIATGTASITDTLGSTTLETVPLSTDGPNSTGDAQFLDCLVPSPVCLSTGSTHVINVSYPGDNSFLASNTNTMGEAVTIAVTSAVTSTTVSCTAPCTTVSAGTSVTLNATVATSSYGVAPNGKVQFFSNGSALGSPVAVTGTAGTGVLVSEFVLGSPAAATASLTTTTLPTGTDNITVQYTGDSPGTNYAASAASSPITITSTGPTFTVAANPTTINVNAPGQSGPTTVTLTSVTTFAGTPSALTCTGLPSESTCNFNPAPSAITLTAGGTATTTLTISTTAASGVAPGAGSRRTPPGWRNIPGSVALSCVLGMMLVALVALGLRGTRRRWNFALGFAVFVLLVVNVGCGGGGGGGVVHDPGTPAGTYPVTITVTIGGVTQTGPVSLVVQ